MDGVVRIKTRSKMLSTRRLVDRRRLYRYIILGAILVLGGVCLYFHNNFTETTNTTDVAASPTELSTVFKTKCHILIMVVSTPKNTRNREMLRWNSYLGYPWVYNRTDIDFRYVFILGKTQDKAINDFAVKEAEVYGDIAIGDFKDSYSNLSEKVIWGFQYALKNFDFTFCVKVDEDSFINITFLKAQLNQVDPHSLPKYYAGKPRQGDLKVPKHGKFKVDYWEHDEIAEYVEYNLGGGYVLSQEAMTKIMTAHKSGAIEMLAWEDVYIGMLAYLVDIKPIRIYHYYISKFYPFCTDDKSILLHHTQPELQAKMLHHYHKKGKYCPKQISEVEVMKLINSYEMIDWRDY